MAKVLLGVDPGPPLTRGLLRIYLESAGHQVREVCDGEAVLAEAATGAADVVVLDTAMPNLDGFQVLARLHASVPTPRAPILVISTIPAQLGRRLVESMGAALYLHKPFTFEALGIALGEVLGEPTAHNAASAPHAHTNGTNGAGPHPLRDAAKPGRVPARQRPAG